MRAIIFLALVACGSGEIEHSAVRYSNATQHYSVDQPDDWDVSAEGAVTRFAPRFNRAEAKHTIVIRSAPRPREIVEGKPTTNEDVIAATARVLAALPRAKVEGRELVEGAGLPGVRFSVTFTPNSATKRYQRTHVTLFGRTHVFHVIYTAPEGEPIDEVALKQVVATLDEET